MRPARGLTLLEVLIAASLALVLLGLLHRFLVPIIWSSSKTSVRAHLSQQGQVALNSLAETLRLSSASGLSYLDQASPDSPVILSACPSAGIASSGRRVFSQNLKVFTWNPETGRLSLNLWPQSLPDLGLDPDPSRPTTLTPEQLSQFLTVVEQGKLLASDVKEFEPLQSFPAPPVIKLRILLEKDIPGRPEPARLELKRTVYLRNR